MTRTSATFRIRFSRELVIMLAATGLVGLSLLRRWIRHWGSTLEERGRSFPSDEIVPIADYLTTRAVTTNAPVVRVWPWLVQMGYQRGGLYSYDWLDRLFGYIDRPSANEILPSFQHLEPGDVIPIGKGPDWPVHTVEPHHVLVLNPRSSDFSVSWAFILEPDQYGDTRLVSRVRASFRPKPIAKLLVLLALEPAALLMERRMLLGIKERAERLSDSNCVVARL